MTLEELIEACVALKKGDTDFALFRYDDGWAAELGNPCSAVSLGESAGEFIGSGATAMAAVEDLMSQLKITGGVR